MAEVFRAKASGAHGFEKTLAIKRILPDLARDPEFEQRFINEAKLAVKLSHANIVQVFDFGRFAGSLFIAMEFVDGLDLAHLLRACRASGDQLTIESALYIAIEMARGLDFAHRRRVIHRDVSPSNILLSRAGEVKIADFGIAEAAKRKHQASGGARRIMGKWRYMSPEQARGEPLTTASDIFSAGVVIYELVTGEKLFPGDEAEEIIENIESMAIKRAAEVRTDVPPRVDEILARALERDPGDRPSAAEVLRELLELSYERTIVASPLGVAEAVESVIGKASSDDSGDAMNLDGLIRAQLADSQGRATTVRKTAVGEPDEALQDPTTAHSVVKRVDEDGITVLEIDNTAAAAPAAMGRGRRTSEAPPIATDLEDSLDDLAEKLATEPAEIDELTDRGRAGRTWWLLAALAATALVAGGGVWIAQRGDTAEPVKLPVEVVDDAGVVASAVATLTIDSEPRGAEVFIDGVLQDGRTPLTVEVEPREPHQIELRADGYASALQSDVVLAPGQNMTIVRPLQRLVAELRVDSRPQGAVVYLGDRRLGETPLVRADLAPGKGQVIRIIKEDFKPASETVDLAPGEPARVSVSLESALRYGYVRIRPVSSRGRWAYIEFKGNRLRTRDGEPLTVPRFIVKLPVGRQRIRLINDAEPGFSKVAVIDVPETSPEAPKTLAVTID